MALHLWHSAAENNKFNQWRQPALGLLLGEAAGGDRPPFPMEAARPRAAARQKRPGATALLFNGGSPPAFRSLGSGDFSRLFAFPQRERIGREVRRIVPNVSNDSGKVDGVADNGIAVVCLPKSAVSDLPRGNGFPRTNKLGEACSWRAEHMDMIRHYHPARKLGANGFVAHQDGGQGLPLFGIPQHTGPASPVEQLLDLLCKFIVILALTLRRPRLRMQRKPCLSLLTVGIQKICGQRISQPESDKLPGSSLLPMGQLVPVNIDRVQWTEKLGAHEPHHLSATEESSNRKCANGGSPPSGCCSAWRPGTALLFSWRQPALGLLFGMAAGGDRPPFQWRQPALGLLLGDGGRGRPPSFVIE